MGVYEGRAQLGKAMKDLEQKWMATKADWADSVAERFEKNFLDALEKELRSATSAMEHMNVIVTQAKRDCSA